MYPGVHRQTQPDKIAYRMVVAADVVAGEHESGERSVSEPRPEQTVTYAQLDCRSNQGAHLFRSLGLNKGSGIAILLPNVVEYLQIAWAAQRAGLYYTPISVLYQQDEIEFIIGNCDAQLLITNEHLASRIDSGMLGIRTLLIDDGGWRTAIGDFPDTPIADESEGAEMIYSSGTTGKPKGVRFPLTDAPPGTVSRLVATRIALHGMNDRVRYLSTAPLYHSAPLRYNMMVTRLGGTAIIMEKFDAESALALIQHFRITHSQWVPTMFVRLLQLPEAVRESYDTSSLKYAIHAAAPCPIHIKERMIDWWGPTLYEYYSGTEANGSTAISSEEWLHHRGSVGRSIHGEVHILDEQGNELPAHRTGTVYFANGSDFSYYKDPENTLAAKTADGWSTLGDIGYLDDDAYLYLKDRQSFMIISGGVNIYPQEVEDALITHPDIYDVAVFGIPNAEFGEEVKAVVQLIDQRSASTEMAVSLIAFCRERISHVKCPRSVDFVAKLPRHPTGKLYKRELRDQYWEGHESKLL